MRGGRPGRDGALGTGGHRAARAGAGGERGRRACRLAGKPEVTPLAGDGTPLPAQTVVTLEWRSPGYVLLRPGQRAAARVGWSSWCGRQAGGRARVRWDSGEAAAEVHGPAQPECSPGAPGNLVSSWFELIG